MVNDKYNKKGSSIRGAFLVFNLVNWISYSLLEEV